MSKLAGHMALYAAYHQHPHNKLTHVFGVPAIIFAVLLLMAYPQVEVGGVPVSLAALFVAGMTLFYISLDVVIGATVGLLAVPLLLLAHWVAAQPLEVGIAVGLATFIGGWAVQLLGHKFEGNKPALTQNLLQIFVALLFLGAEAFFALGLRKELEREVEHLVATGAAGRRPAHA